MSGQIPSNSLLVEFLTEELPPLNLETAIGLSFSEALKTQLSGFVTDKSKVSSFVTPRRFGCLIENIDISESGTRQTRRGPAISASFVGGNPTPALLGFARSCSIEWEKLDKRADGYVYAETTLPGKALKDVLNDAVNSALKKIPIAKAMRWGDTDYQFIRPVHNLVVMLDEEIMPVACFGVQAVNTTRGHRFMSGGTITIGSAHTYFSNMYETGKVISSFIARKELIKHNLDKKARELGLAISPIEGLLDEVTALVEWPEILAGSFNQKYLQVPKECLILSMAKNQKYFALVDAKGKLSNKFLFVANLVSPEPQVIIEGNQKVLAARLADAEFFYEFDKRTKLSDFVARAQDVVYHSRLGSQFERVTRLQEIAAGIAPMLGVDVVLARKTAYLLKADLVTGMVGEFPELQGVMGKYYAIASGETREVANAIEKHYYPRFSGDILPDSPLAIAMALTDKLEDMVGIWGIGLIPGGDKDPYGLRRAALGVIRILLDYDLDLKSLLEIAFKAFAGKSLAENTISGLYQFIISRLANYLSSVENYPVKVINAVLSSENLAYAANGAKKFNYLPSLLKVLAKFAGDPLNQPLLEANKRIENILKKNQEQLAGGLIMPELIKDKAELDLYRLLVAKLGSGEILAELKKREAWPEYFAALAGFNLALANFFNEVMVMTEDIALRQNRLSLLSELYKYFNLVCKLSELT